VQQGTDAGMLNAKTPPMELDPDEYQRRMLHHIKLIRDFCDGLEFQWRFNDYRMLEALVSFCDYFSGLFTERRQIKSKPDRSLKLVTQRQIIATSSCLVSGFNPGV
jgi:hypothetical protein